MPLHQGPDISGMGMAWCRRLKVVPGGGVSTRLSFFSDCRSGGGVGTRSFFSSDCRSTGGVGTRLLVLSFSSGVGNVVSDSSVSVCSKLSSSGTSGAS